jgi:hypothetical protein
MGSFASTCQASHVLGLVVSHRDDPRKSTTDPHFRLSEAHQLHQTLVALNKHLAQKPPDSSTVLATALCYSARLVLYHMYTCNVQFSALGVRLAEETDMQRASIDGCKEVTREVCRFVEVLSDDGISQNPFLCHCLYEASAVFAWFIREENKIEEIAGLRVIVRRLREMGRSWRVAGKFHLLSKKLGCVLANSIGRGVS